jgi:histidinol-phosphate phosphatase family protein
MRRCVFMDRDGVINRKPPEHDYIRRWEDFEFLPGIANWIRLFNVLGHPVLVITNQRGVARELITLDELEEIHRRMKDALEAEGARIDGVFCCPHEEGACDCRKPRPGLILEAQRKWDADLAHSLYIGDSETDRQLAATCGMAFARFENGQPVEVIRA